MKKFPRRRSCREVRLTPFAFNVSIPSSEWPYLLVLQRLALALALGFFVGLERQRRAERSAWLGTFAFAGLLGCLGGLLGESFALLSLALIGLLVVLLDRPRPAGRPRHRVDHLAAPLVIGFTGVLCGHGHTLTPAAVGVLTAALLAWKESLAGFSVGLTEAEVRLAVLLAILAFVVYPALPERAVDPWGLIWPRAAWVTVLLIAGIGFGNYILLKMYGRQAVELTGFFGGLVNSTVTVTVLAGRVRETEGLADVAYRGIVLATAAMVVRNGVLLAILAPHALASAAPAFLLMLAASVVLVALRRQPANPYPPSAKGLPLQSPFSLGGVLKFGVLFLALQVAGTLAQGWLGRFGFYAVSLAGGLVSSASAVASAGLLAAHGLIPAAVAGTGAVLASLTSAL